MKITSLRQKRESDINFIEVVFQEGKKTFCLEVDSERDSELYILVEEILITNLDVNESTNKLLDIMKKENVKLK